jgi:hypothetical protein
MDSEIRESSRRNANTAYFASPWLCAGSAVESNAPSARRQWPARFCVNGSGSRRSNFEFRTRRGYAEQNVNCGRSWRRSRRKDFHGAIDVWNQKGCGDFDLGGARRRLFSRRAHSSGAEGCAGDPRRCCVAADFGERFCPEIADAFVEVDSEQGHDDCSRSRTSVGD